VTEVRSSIAIARLRPRVTRWISRKFRPLGPRRRGQRSEIRTAFVCERRISDYRSRARAIFTARRGRINAAFPFPPQFLPELSTALRKRVALSTIAALPRFLSVSLLSPPRDARIKDKRARLLFANSFFHRASSRAIISLVIISVENLVIGN